MIEMDNRITQIYDQIETYKVQHGYSPTYEDIAQALGMHKAQVVQAMERMERLGMIVQPRGLLKAIKLVSRQPNEHKLRTRSSAIDQ